MSVSGLKSGKKQKKLKIRKRFDKADCSKLAWNYKLHVVNKEIVPEKEINLWIREGNKWTRIYYDSFPLEWYNCDSSSGQKLLKKTNKHLFVKKGAIHFAGGYLAIQDTDLLEHINEQTDLELKNKKEVFSKLFTEDCEPEYPQIISMTEFLTNIFPQIDAVGRPEFDSLPETLQTTYKALQSQLEVETRSSAPNPWQNESAERQEPLGKNIHFEAEFDIRPSQQSFQPLFFYSQDDSSERKDRGNIQLGIQQQAKGENSIFWEISHQRFRTNPYSLSGKQYVVVSQDANWLQMPDMQTPTSIEESHSNQEKGPQAHFEFFVNSVALKTKYSLISLPFSQFVWRQMTKDVDKNSYIDRKVNHPLGIGQRVFFVGHRPQENGESGTFQGSIRRIFFDPNASCPTCVD